MLLLYLLYVANRQVFVRFLSASSAMHGVEISGVARYLAENRNRAFMHWDAISYPRSVVLRILYAFSGRITCRVQHDVHSLIRRENRFRMHPGDGFLLLYHRNNISITQPGT